MKVNEKHTEGLTSEEVIRSRKRYGENKLKEQKRQSFVGKFFANFADPIIRILLCALGINLLFMFKNMNIIETLGIVSAIFLATFISTVSEYGSEQAFERMKQEAEQTYCRVKRDGEVVSLPIGELVVGDVIHLGAGEKIPADCRIVTGALKVDQSALNGESREVSKQPSSKKNELALDTPDALLRGCVICSGTCSAVVEVVGDETLYGKLAGEVQEETRESPLKLRLSHLAGTISKIGYAAAILVAAAYLFDVFIIESQFNMVIAGEKLTNLAYLGDQLIHALTLGITVIIVAVPEGLPMMITVVLSSNMKRMMKDHVLVRKLVGIETAGSMNILFCDKTGTITKGSLRTAVYMPAYSMEEVIPSACSRCGKIGEIIELSATLNSECEAAGGGNATDRALFADFGESLLGKSYSVTEKLPFDSRYKYSAVKLEGRESLVLVKGAPEILIGSAYTYIDEMGRRQALTSVKRAEMMRRIKEHAEGASRIIAIAVSDKMPTGDNLPPMTLAAFAVLKDEIRPQVRGALKEMQRAGVQVVMITGDNRDTAAAVAIEAGLIHSGARALVITGEELAMLDDHALKELLPRIRVVARALPSDKTRLVRAAQELGLVAGMTGDGINDAPALKCADVGFAMGAGTEVAKEAGDIVILDNNFASIVRAVLYGRTIFKSIRKFIVFQLTMNMCAVGISLVGPFVGIDTPVTVIQMLWINMIMDTLGALAFAGEAPHIGYMKEKPKRRDERLLTGEMTRQIIHDGVFTIGLSLFYLLSPLTRAYFEYEQDILRFMTGFFALFIFSSVLNCFNTRTERLNLLSGLGKNRPFCVIIIFIMLVELILIYFGGSMFRTDGLTLKELGMVLMLAVSVIPADLIRKIFLRLNGKRSFY
ncbi:MAG: calcium-translocating P-type ATPase, PMCA-type [Clostridia bacterium]|nr:calcium-translocating P-type ATPase, PMCA-type [Clostridia bacterium]